MKNNKLIKYNDSVFSKIFHFFKKLFSRKNISTGKNINEKTITDNKNKVDFLENVKFKESEEEKSLKQLKLQYDNGEIDEDDLTEEEIEKLVTLYEKETEELNADTARRKNHIAQMLKELKYS